MVKMCFVLYRSLSLTVKKNPLKPFLLLYCNKQFLVFHLREKAETSVANCGICLISHTFTCSLLIIFKKSIESGVLDMLLRKRKSSAHNKTSLGWRPVSTGSNNVNYLPLGHIYLYKYPVSRERTFPWNEATVLSVAKHSGGLILNQGKKAISTPTALIQF